MCRRALVVVFAALLVVVPAQTAAVDRLEAGQDAGGLAQRISAAGGLAGLALAAVIVLMVLKPGA